MGPQGPPRSAFKLNAPQTDDGEEEEGGREEEEPVDSQAPFGTISGAIDNPNDHYSPTSTSPTSASADQTSNTNTSTTPRRNSRNMGFSGTNSADRRNRRRSGGRFQAQQPAPVFNENHHDPNNDDDDQRQQLQHHPHKNNHTNGQFHLPPNFYPKQPPMEQQQQQQQQQQQGNGYPSSSYPPVYQQNISGGYTPVPQNPNQQQPGDLPPLDLKDPRIVALLHQHAAQIRFQQQSSSYQQQHGLPQNYDEPGYPNGSGSNNNGSGNGNNNNNDNRLPLRFLIVVGLLVICLLVGLIVAVAIALGGTTAFTPAGPTTPTQAPVNSFPSLPPNVPPTAEPDNDGIDSPTGPPNESLFEHNLDENTTLGQIVKRGFLRCGVSNSQPGFVEIDPETSRYRGFDVDMCRAVAAGIFGVDEKVEYIGVNAYDRFQNLLNGDYDMLSRATTHTMERDVFEPRTKAGFSFSIPYLYNGMQFGGVPPFVHCADNLTVSTEECAETKICVLDGTTHVETVLRLIPNVQVLKAVDNDLFYENFRRGFCNVVAGEQYDIAESVLKQRGYSGIYDYGRKIHSKEPLCIVTREDDPQWSDFTNWILQGLLAAEDEAITSRTANIIPPTLVEFGGTGLFRKMFRDAVRIVGNYQEIYRNNLEAILPRPIPDRLNSGSSGLIYSFPFGDVNVTGDGPTVDGTLETIYKRGYLRCGISTRVIFARYNETTETWSGFDVDFCKALSAAIFDGVSDTVEYTDLAASERFQALQDGTVDVLSRLTTVTLQRDVMEPNANAGFSFSQPNFYDGLIFGGIPPFAQCANRLDVTSTQCQDLKICVSRGTTFEELLSSLFPERFIVPRQNSELTLAGLTNGECNVIAGGVVDVSVTSVKGADYDGPYETSENRYSKDPLALVTRQDDVQWSSFVWWVVSAIFFAEENDITQQTAMEQMPQVGLFGPLFYDMFRNAVAAVGSYGEIYAREAENDVPRGGLNLVNELLSGPQHYPLPGVI